MKKSNLLIVKKIFAPVQDKTNKMKGAPSEDSDQISMGVRPACALLEAKDPMIRHANSEDWSDWEDALGWSVFAWRTFHFVGAHVYFHTHQSFFKSLDKNQSIISCLLSKIVLLNLF